MSGEIRNFFTFDLSSLSDAVVSATLRLTRFDYYSSADSEIYGLFDVSTDTAILNDTNGVNAAIYADLGTGVSYGEFEVFSTSDPNDVLTFVLNAAAIDAINAASGGWFSIGGVLLSPGSPSQDVEGLFAGSHKDDGVQELVLEVIPEPATITLLAIGALLVRKRQ